LGEENKGINILMSGLDTERVTVSAIPLGLAQGALREALQYSQQRKQFGKYICEFQLTQAKLADMYTKIEAGRLLTYDAAMQLDNGEKVTLKATAAILFTSEAATKIASDALQIHGGYGYTLEYPVNRYFRDAKSYEIGAGSTEIRRLIIARELLGIKTF
jgi:isovaleryl-CoA dehydrogenase